MNNEKWDYKIDGKNNGIARIIFCLTLSAVFIILTVDQILPLPVKSPIVALSFGAPAVISLSILIILTIRYFNLKIYIGREGFYFQSLPWNGKYYRYVEIKSCSEELKIYRHHRHGDTLYYYYFFFTEKNGKTTKFQFEKSVSEREISELKKRIEANSHPQAPVSKKVNQNKTSKNKNVLAFFIIVLLAVISSIGIYFVRIEQYRDWTYTSGVISKIEQYRGRSRSHRIYYAYTVNGKAYTGNDLYSRNQSNFSESDAVNIWYNPDNPSQCSFHKPSPGIDSIAPIFLGFPLSLAALFDNKSRTNRRLGKYR